VPLLDLFFSWPFGLLWRIFVACAFLAVGTHAVFNMEKQSERNQIVNHVTVMP
jgi:hypothetical protein